MPSQLEGAMDALITVFYNYSGNDGDKFKLNKGELKELLNSELTDFLTVRVNITASPLCCCSSSLSCSLVKIVRHSDELFAEIFVTSNREHSLLKRKR